jgi:hypothetical protein
MMVVAGTTNGRTLGPAAWRHQNRDVLNEAHVPLDLLFCFFFFAMTLLLDLLMRPTLLETVAHYK